jgi:hypothetical protein
MKDKVEYFELGQVPKSVMKEASDIAHNYTICFHREGETCGSGVLVQFGNMRGILTAGHVPANPKNANLRFNFKDPNQTVGIILKKYAHNFTLPTRSLSQTVIGNLEFNEWGPDLTFLKIDESHINKISPHKSFYNLGKDTMKRLSHSLSDLGFFVICGYPQELTLIIEGDHHFSEKQQVPAIGGATLRQDYHSLNGYDCIDVGYEWATDPTVPKNAGGMSGCGIWRFDITKYSNGEFILKENEYSLAGIAFYQSPEVNSRCIIRGMGGESIYKNTVNKLKAEIEKRA